jgi:hypothetical protein
MADITGNAEAGVGRSDDSLGRWVVKKITPVSDGVDATGTHNVVDVPANNFVAMGFFVVTTSFTSTSNTGTIQFKVGSAAMGAAITADGTELQSGDVLFLSANDYADTAGSALYVTSADTVDFVVATNAITAGAGYLILLLVDLIDE